MMRGFLWISAVGQAFLLFAVSGKSVSAIAFHGTLTLAMVIIAVGQEVVEAIRDTNK
jgi:hypothetical protein